MKRYDLTDFGWSVIEPWLANKPRGVLRVDDRRVLNDITRVLRSGARAGALRALHHWSGPRGPLQIGVQYCPPEWHGGGCSGSQ